MAALVLDGKILSEKVLAETSLEASAFQKEYGRKVTLAVILVGENAASKVYVAAKTRSAEKTGLAVVDKKLPATITQAGLNKIIQQLNDDPIVDGILLQLPLPTGLSEEESIAQIEPKKDVDGLTSYNIGRLLRGETGPRSCTPLGCMRMIDEAYLTLDGTKDISGKTALVIGRSNLVGKPLGILLLERGCTLTYAHSKTKDLDKLIAATEIICVAIGRPNYVLGENLSSSSVVIDVGINRLENKKLVGDVEYASAFEKVRAITPVPGGVGPMTVSMLIKNTVEAAFRNIR